MSEKKGSLVFIHVDGKVLVGQTTLSYASACDMIDISSKDTGRHRVFDAGKISKTVSVSGIGDTNAEATNTGFYALEDAQDGGSSVALVFTEYTDKTAATAATGAESRSATAYISNLSWDANDNEAISFSADFQISGEITRTTTA